MVFQYVLRSLRGANLEIFKVYRSYHLPIVGNIPLCACPNGVQFGVYLAFPIGWMYYFGTNLEERFAVPGFWPTQEQSNKIPYERDEIKAEVERLNNAMKERELERRRRAEEALGAAKLAFRESKGNQEDTA